MAHSILITVGELQVEAQLNDSETSSKIIEDLPLSGSVSTWGDEIYFTIPVTSALDKEAREVVEIGEIGYWPPGRAFCIFFGETPMSNTGEIRAASPVNIIGTVNGDTGCLKKVNGGDTIKISKK